MKRGTKINRIGVGVTSYLKVKDYAILEDNWITEHDKVLVDQNGNQYNVLDFIEIKENTLVMDTLPYYSGWVELKKSYVKLDKKINKNDILYVL